MPLVPRRDPLVTEPLSHRGAASYAAPMNDAHAAHRADSAIVAAVAAAVVFVLHLIANPHYGFFRDELYFIICGFHPQFGYVDQPPLVPLAAAATQLFGHSLFLLRAVPALLAGAAVGVAVLLAAELGGRRFGQILTAIVVGLTPVLMSFGGKVSTDEANPLLWTLAAYALLRVLDGDDERWALVAGAALGTAFETKYSVVFFAAALIGGLILSPQRSLFRCRMFWAGTALAISIALPNAIWQAVHGFPMLELLEAGQNGKNVIVGPLAYLGQEVLITGIFLSPVWIIGAIRLLVLPRARFLGWTFVLMIALMIVFHGKHYYPGAVYAIPIAAGCVAIEAWTSRLRIVRPAIALAAIAGGLVFVPFSLPVLSERAFLSYETRVEGKMGVSRSVLATEHHSGEPELPSDWADMHGWPELASAVQRVVDSLPPSDRERAVIVASNYGEASAIDFFGHDLPPVVSGHNQFWLWGTHGRSGDVLIDVDGDCGFSDHLFAHATLATRVDAPWAMTWEQNVPIMICRGIREPLSTVWPSLRQYE
jgi:hypothetical protein